VLGAGMWKNCGMKSRTRGTLELPLPLLSFKGCLRDGRLPEMCITLSRYGFVIERLLMSREQKFVSLISYLEKGEEYFFILLFKILKFTL